MLSSGVSPRNNDITAKVDQKIKDLENHTGFGRPANV